MSNDFKTESSRSTTKFVSNAITLPYLICFSRFNWMRENVRRYQNDMLENILRRSISGNETAKIVPR